MDIQNAKLIPDLRVYEEAKVSRDHGRARCKELEDTGQISPLWTPTGRCLLSVTEAALLAKSL